MDRDEAHKLLGLYLGATREQIEAKHAELLAKSGADPQAAARLDMARDVALNRPTQVIAARPHPLKRGPVVLLLLLIALTMVAGGFWIVAKGFDRSRDERQTRELATRATSLRDAWHGYLKSAGISQTPDGERAEAVFQGAGQLLEQGDFTNANDDYETAMQLYNSAFAAEAGRVEAAWQRDVLDFVAAKLKGRFPFDVDAEAEAEADDVARLLNPASGAIWAITREHDVLAGIEVDGRSFATPLKGRETMVAAAAPLRDALFGAHSPTIDVKFKIGVTAPRAPAELKLEVGGVVCSNRKEGLQSARWTQAAGGVVLTRNAIGEAQDATIDKSNSDWGLLQVLAFGEFAGEGDLGLTWEFSAESVGGKKARGKDAMIHVRLERAANPFDFAIYGALEK